MWGPFGCCVYVDKARQYMCSQAYVYLHSHSPARQAKECAAIGPEVRNKHKAEDRSLRVDQTRMPSTTEPHAMKSKITYPRDTSNYEGCSRAWLRLVREANVSGMSMEVMVSGAEKHGIAAVHPHQKL